MNVFFSASMALRGKSPLPMVAQTSSLKVTAARQFSGLE